MNFEEMQKAWQSQDQGPKLAIDANALLKEVRRNQQHFRTTILWRDVREVGVAFGLAFYFLWRGSRYEWPVVLACVWIGLFMIADRLRQRPKRPAPNNSLKACLENSRREVGHQIWLLRNVTWWYLLPLAVGLAISISHTIHLRHGADPLVFWAAYLVFCALLFLGVYWLNQFAVRKHLQPRLEELDALLAELKD